MSRLKELANPWVPGLVTYEPGKPIEEVARELDFESADDIIKLASNENALGPSPKALAALKKAARQVHLYPDGGAFYLRQALASKLGVDLNEIVFGAGSNELIAMLSNVFLNPQANIVMAEKSFVVYKLVAALFNARTILAPMRDLTHDLEAMLAAITPETRLVYVANPNNPTGTMVHQMEIDRFMARVPDHVVVVFDEAYVELLEPSLQPDTLKYVREGRPVYVLRSFSKSYGLAGLRIGYAIAHPTGIELLNKVRQPFNVTSVAQAAALAALEDEEHLVSAREMISQGLAFLEKACHQMGLEFVPSVTNFMLIKTGHGRDVFHALQRKKVIVRPMDGFGLPDHVRVTIGTPRENRHFIKALKEVLKEMRG